MRTRGTDVLIVGARLFHFAEDMGTPGYNNPLNAMLYRRIAKSAELLRGRLGVLAPFLAAGKRGGALAKELAEWTARAEQARAAAKDAPRRHSFTTSRAA